MPIHVPICEPVEAIDRPAGVRRAQVGVALGHLEIGVPQELLHVLEARSAHHEVRGRRMPQIVEPEPLDAGPLKGGRERGADLAPGRPAAALEDEAFPAL